MVFFLNVKNPSNEKDCASAFVHDGVSVRSGGC